MEVFIKMKYVGKRRPILADTSYTLHEDIGCLRHLIETVVRQEVESYNHKGFDKKLIPFLTESEIENAQTVGKVGFGRVYSEEKAEPKEAIRVALQGFEDGLFRVVVGQTEILDLESSLTVTPGTTITFIRLAFLAGRLW